MREEISGENAWRVVSTPCTGEAHDAERYARARRLSDISDELLALDFAGYDATDNPEALATAQAWATDDGMLETPWLLLYGLTGTGKTHLLAAALNALMARGRFPLYTLTPALLQHIRDGLDEKQSQEYSLRFRAVQEAPILILDDLGAEMRTEWADETLFKILDYRYRHQAPTAVATNLMPDHLAPRIASRLQDWHLARCVMMAGDDRRKRARHSDPTAGRKAERKGAR